MRKMNWRSLAMLQGKVAPLIATFILGALSILLTFHEGQRRGMDYIFNAGADSEQSAIAIALSDLVHGLDAGYVGYGAIRKTLVDNWPKGSETIRSRIQLDGSMKAKQNAAILAAASMPQPKAAFISDRSLITMIYDDMGLVDFVKLSFRLFGMNMESMHYTYFLLLSISALIYLVTFRSDRTALAFLLATLFAFYIEIYTAYFDYISTFSGMRHGSTLALVPMWHFAFLMLRRGRFELTFTRALHARLPVPDIRTVGLIAGALWQLALMILAIRMRGSAIWAVLFLVVLAAFLAVLPFWRQRFALWPWRQIAVTAAAWPTVALLLGIVANNLYMNAKMHPVYFTDDVLPYHGLWHSAFIGFRSSPDVMPARSAALVRANGGLDRAGYLAAEDYLDQIHFIQASPDPASLPPTYISPWTGTLKFRLHDNIMRRIVLDIAVRHPLEMVVLYAYKKPLAIVRSTIQVVDEGETLAWLALVVLGGLIVGLMLAGGSGEADEFGTILGLVAAPIPFVALPSLWAFSEMWTLADFYLIVWIVMQIAIAVAVIVAARRAGLIRAHRVAPLG